MNDSLSVSMAASMLGPMLPRSVESKVLQYLIWIVLGDSVAAARTAEAVFCRLLGVIGPAFRLRRRHPGSVLSTFPDRWVLQIRGPSTLKHRGLRTCRRGRKRRYRRPQSRHRECCS